MNDFGPPRFDFGASGKADAGTDSKYRIALYIRISVEDEDMGRNGKDESNSVTNQRAMLRDFVGRQEEFRGSTVMELCDDGCSGASFDRPAVRQMLELAKDNTINCIIVKDFSRFGRNYLEAGEYLEQIFPLMGIRFISINDHYDSGRPLGTGTGIHTAARNLFNDYYSKDISAKVKASFQIKKARGQHLGGGIPYGYRRSPDERGRILIDEAAANVIRRIFAMTREGLGRTQIARILNEQGIPSPAEHINGLSGRNTVRKRARGKYCWTSDAIIRILRNEAYTGKCVNNKYAVKAIGSRQTVLLPRESWHYVPDSHEAIIEKDLFEAVRKTFRRNHGGSGKNSSLAGKITGKVKCGGCGYGMDLIKSNHPYYKCATHRFLAGSKCSGDHADAGALEDICDCLETLICGICLPDRRKVPDGNSCGNLHSAGQSKKLRAQLNRIRDQERKLYERYKENLLTQEEYVRQKELCCLKRSEAENRPEAIDTGIVLPDTGQRGEMRSLPKPEQDGEVQHIPGPVIKAVYFYDKSHMEIVL